MARIGEEGVDVRFVDHELGELSEGTRLRE
jgi:hypothetical protein